MQDGLRPVAVGLLLLFNGSGDLSLIVALGTALTTPVSADTEVGVAVSLRCRRLLLLIAAINLFIFLGIYKAFRESRAGRVQNDAALADMLNGPGLLARMLRPLFRFVGRSWHMYPVGFLFGLGFDTALEIALLGLAATQAGLHVPLWTIMVFPLLFTAGMCLVDTTAGVVMVGAYGWAFVKPMRKLFYNMIITFGSFLIALVIGSVAALKAIASRGHYEGGIWQLANILTESRRHGIRHYHAIPGRLVGLLGRLSIRRERPA